MKPEDAFFIGWNPMPKLLAKFLLPVAVGTVVGALALAGWIAWSQQSPGNGQWHDAARSYEGYVVAEPYPMLRVQNGDRVETLFLVEEGKQSAKNRVRGFAGQPVRVTGTLIERDGIRMLELEPGDAALEPISLPAIREDAVQRGTVTLDGEIVDSKCYLGAMKPGVGKTHKGCAILCLKGGIPPLFVTRDASGQTSHYLLLNAAGEPLEPRYFAFAGDRITLRGQAEICDGLLRLRVADSSFDSLR